VVARDEDAQLDVLVVRVDNSVGNGIRHGGSQNRGSGLDAIVGREQGLAWEPRQSQLDPGVGPGKDGLNIPLDQPRPQLAQSPSAVVAERIVAAHVICLGEVAPAAALAHRSLVEALGHTQGVGFEAETDQPHDVVALGVFDIAIAGP
jgi:hypothetical protein